TWVRAWPTPRAPPPPPCGLVLGDQHGPGQVRPGRRPREQVGVGGARFVDDVEVGLKWPNDVLAGPPGCPGKLAGILAEVARPVVVIGLGLNVFEAPDGIEGATSLADLGLASPHRTRLVSGLLTELGRRIVAWRAARGADWALAADYRARSLTLGNRVRAHLPGGREVVGVATAVDDQGRLCIDTGGGTVVVSAGDVVHLR
ncbi:biotin--[acetyl-CoA-carboxylase] ligase, partial [Mycobacterium malmoense]|uniref:biotin--[acetyl-CoA-carboxylase] ligase n=1 Tax=Mycobacterium malmoense TaxID=1780 RepID=UPI000B1BDC25